MSQLYTFTTPISRKLKRIIKNRDIIEDEWKVWDFCSNASYLYIKNSDVIEFSLLQELAKIIDIGHIYQKDGHFVILIQEKGESLK